MVTRARELLRCEDATFPNLEEFPSDSEGLDPRSGVLPWYRDRQPLQPQRGCVPGTTDHRARHPEPGGLFRD
ncbi:hypothetical protein OP10G_4519 [Fimbriimonas ginsengisoli Gsoil 348]|uniref:Uncharacterized protein n=1 Tax=Fimbriimonas ginsengisoli Gsoil 348 TaxID=661478 RepID=A0A068NWZ4_FIMGI|nr:hypothetical protein OP10G_4519 [Fimbriimonas ginsengisoli Gsoil 348]